MTIIGPNKNQLYGKFIILIIFTGLILLFVSLIFNPKGNTNISNNTWLMPAIMVVLLLLFSSTIVLQLFYIPIGVDVYDSNEMGIKYCLAKPIYINAGNIKSYASTGTHTRGNNYDGIVIYLTTGEKFLFSDFNLEDHSPISLFLDHVGVAYSGKESFGFLSYYFQRIGKNPNL